VPENISCVLFGNISPPTTCPAPELVVARRNLEQSRGRANPK
jgi:hypothetical protein